MGRPRKSLYDLAIRDKTFKARKHAERLLEEPLLEAPKLRAIQRRYRMEGHPLDRAEVAREFERATRPRDRLAEAIDAIDVDVEIDAILRSVRKTLSERVLEGSFRSDRHRELLEEEQLEGECPLHGVEARRTWAQLRLLQELYLLGLRNPVSLRQRLVREFAATARALPPRKTGEEGS
jgi:hypothetical protein